MNGKEFKEWRERVGLTQQQLADKLRVTRTTISKLARAQRLYHKPLICAAKSGEARLKQENPDLGQVTMIYSDGPMFVDPYGPRRRLAMMQQEPYPTNTAALARVQQLWGEMNFTTPLSLKNPAHLCGMSLS